MDFTAKHKDRIRGTLHGFDRIIFKGYFMNFFISSGMYYYLHRKDIMLVDYRKFVNGQTQGLLKHVEKLAEGACTRIQYINNPKISKEQIAKAALKKHPTRQGLIAVLSTLELENSFELRSCKCRKS